VDSFDALLREMMLVAATLSVPVLGVAALVGTGIAIVQAATQIQEQTLTLLPKIVAVGFLIGIGGGFGMHLCAQLFNDAVAAIPSLVYGS
jgi:flagellar biosynthetic protein FliQ